MTKTWDEAKVSSLLCSAFAPHIEHQRDTEQPQANIDVLITFDAQGVSSHPNHISLYHGARAFLSALVRGKSGWRPPVDLYTLTSVAMPRKYSSVLDALTTVALWFASSRGAVDKDPEHPASLVFMSQLTGAGDKGSGPPTLGTAWRAMTEAHSSQMRWFRYGWISMSRYMIINDLRLEKAAGEE
jgi:N-acetylglucosaminylphosphatidylinositol deacetylase